MWLISWYFFSPSTKAIFRLVEAGHHGRDAVTSPGRVVEDVHSHHHQVAELGIDLTAPQLAAQLAVDLQGHLLHHGVRLLLVGESLVVDDLTGDGHLHAAELLHRGVPVVSGSGHDHHHHLHVWLDDLPEGVEVGLRPVIGE